MGTANSLTMSWTGLTQNILYTCDHFTRFSLVLGESDVSLRVVTSNVVEHLLRVNQHIDCDAICRLSM